MTNFQERHAESLGRIALENKIEAVKSLNGRIFAMLSPEEKDLLQFFRQEGRKYGVTVSFTDKVTQEALANAVSNREADHILKTSNSRILIVVN